MGTAFAELGLACQLGGIKSIRREVVHLAEGLPIMQEALGSPEQHKQEVVAQACNPKI